MQTKIRVTSIQRLCVHDGPGVRTTVFLKGCYLECPWCCNPEAIHFSKDIYFVSGCKYSETIKKSSLCSRCELYGGNISKENCPFLAFVPTYKDYTVQELFDVLIKDLSLYVRGGGITFSGGEPLLQAVAIYPLLIKLKQAGVHIAIETTLYAPTKQFILLANLVDYWIVDLKIQYGYMINKDYSIGNPFPNNLRTLQTNKAKVEYRIVIIADCLKRKEIIVSRLLEYRIRKIKLLACHSLAKNKYLQLNKDYISFELKNTDELYYLSDYIKSYEIESDIYTI